ncbi:MAG: hypothetical protein V5B35_05260 [Candidatus Accumulibacter necessarius]|jgi:hypothetical protein|uniref:hypothetical protein n=1 Tax=Candidatus Accumulibacter necessarius TaxID=2954386 RepID=UPI002FC2D90B
MRIQLKWQFKKTRTRHTYQLAGNGPFFKKSDPAEVPTAENDDPIPLGAVAQCAARAKATKGGVPFDQLTYQDFTRQMVRGLVEAARAGRIHLVDEIGLPGTFDEILERARDDGWTCDAWSNPGATETEKNFSYCLVLFSTLDSINAWAATVGDEFYIDAPEQAAVPSGAPEKAAPEVTPTGIPKEEILAVDWPLFGQFNQESLSTALSDVPEWLKPARTARGSPGKASALWNPAKLADCIVSKKYANQKAAVSFIGKYFADWLPEWEKLQEYR